MKNHAEAARDQIELATECDPDLEAAQTHALLAIAHALLALAPERISDDEIRAAVARGVAHALSTEPEPEPVP
jgi:hypothetical protein